MYNVQCRIIRNYSIWIFFFFAYSTAKTLTKEVQSHSQHSQQAPASPGAPQQRGTVFVSGNSSLACGQFEVSCCTPLR